MTLLYYVEFESVRTRIGQCQWRIHGYAEVQGDGSDRPPNVQIYTGTWTEFDMARGDFFTLLKHFSEEIRTGLTEAFEETYKADKLWVTS